MSGWWERHVVPRLVDLSCGVADLDEHRAEVCRGLAGRVLELGFGSGHNVRHYPTGPEGVTELLAVEPNDVAWRLSEQRRSRSATPVLRSGLDGQRLTEPDGSVDHVLSTFTLCTIPDAGAALAEAQRVLRPGGRLHFLEHGLGASSRVRAWQRRLEPVQRRIAGGCHLTREPVALLVEAGLEVREVSTGYLPGPAFSRPLTFLYRGEAVRG